MKLFALSNVGDAIKEKIKREVNLAVNQKYPMELF
jgi:hypothetical protein